LASTQFELMAKYTGPNNSATGAESFWSTFKHEH
jgi:hypothetical protein